MTRLVEIMSRLRAEDGCPWDREQTHESLKKYALEEVYELLEAIDTECDEKIVEELGDLLLQVVFHAQMAKERGSFSIEDVANGISDKMVRRHPHVFGDVKVNGVADVLSNWEEIKKQEEIDRKTRNGDSEDQANKPSRVGGLPSILPALLMGFRIAEKVPDACRSEEEIENDLSNRQITKDNIGETLKDLSVLAYHWKMDPEELLRQENLAWIKEIDS